MSRMSVFKDFSGLLFVHVCVSMCIVEVMVCSRRCEDIVQSVNRSSSRAQGCFRPGCMLQVQREDVGRNFSRLCTRGLLCAGSCRRDDLLQAMCEDGDQNADRETP